MRVSMPARAPQHFLRLEHNETKPLAGLGAHAYGVVIGAGFDAPHWEGPAGEQLVIPSMPVRGFELRHEVERRGLRLILDPETWRLVELRDHEDRSLNRMARTPVAQAVDLPLVCEALHEDEGVDVLCRAAIDMQANTLFKVPPYFTVRGADDQWIETNFRCLGATLALLPDEDVAAWLRLDRGFALEGPTALLASRYAAAFGQRRGIIVVTVTEMSDVMQDAESLDSYLRFVKSFVDVGLEVIVDGVGEFSPVAVAVGAAGSISGTRIYRSSRLQARHDGGHRRSAQLQYVVPHRLQRMKVGEARRRTQARTIPVCTHEGCRALLPDGEEADVRAHNAHVIADASRLAWRFGPAAFAEHLRGIGLVQLERWAQALDEASERGARSADA